LVKMEKILNEKNGENINIGQRFDLIAGTSTGAIIAGLLAQGVSAVEVCEMYKKEIPMIFGKNMRRNFPFNIFPFSLFVSKYKSTNLEAMAKKYFGDSTFEDVKTDLIVTSVDIAKMSLRLYKTDRLQQHTGQKGVLLANALLASIAAPTYFKVDRGPKHSDYLVDGGIAANNPSLVAVIDALQLENKKDKGKKPASISDIVLLSMGTGKVDALPYDLKPLTDSTIDWIIESHLSLIPPRFHTATPLIDILFETHAKLVEDQVRFLFSTHNHKEGFMRINPLLKSAIKLDDVSKLETLRKLAKLDKEQISWIEKHL
ncbi:MAG: patatin-like phospholipase family protein, partial [Sulfurovum sp.]|nr:patatin-like phospholipase family protein [Sulfurovum sp.]MCB4784558.1 patatin-like phospholipase family protein [Sulfurovum sp.]